jgi:D-alanyl-D-alanine carboxypeptidase
MFTATIIFQLIEEGRLELDSKLSEFFPQVRNSKKITIADMLGHRSGIHNFTNDAGYQEYKAAEKSMQEMVEMIAELEPDFEPNEKTSYSNANYVLLGYIIEALTNATYQQELERRITAKLNLENTYYGDEIDTNRGEAASYSFRQGRWQLMPETDASVPHGAGALVSTPTELAVFVDALFKSKVITKASLSQMQAIKEGLGKGLIRFPFGARRAYGHNGGIDGFASNLAYFPREKVAIAVTANGMNYNFNDLLIGILSIYFNLPFEIPDFTARAVELDTEELKKYEGAYSSKQLRLKITLKVEGGRLYAQASGQPRFPLTPFSRTEFRFETAGVVIAFPETDSGKLQYSSFVLNQAGGKFAYEKQ